jgi:hypothetical protein
MANLTINQGIKFTAGDGTNVIGTGDPSGLNGIIKQSSETGFYIQSSVDYTLNFYDGSSWSAYQSIDVSDANYKGGFAFAWDDNTAAYIKTADASHVVYVFGRDGDLKVDSTPGDATQAADSIVDGSGSLSITSIDAQNDYTEGLSVASDGTVTFDRTDNNAAYQLKFSGSGITIGKNGDDTVTFTGADEFTTPLTTDGDLFIQSGSADARLAIGTDGQYLSVSSGAPAWADLTSLSIGSAQQIPFMNDGATDLSYDAKLTFTDGNNASLNVDRYGYGDAIKLGDTHPTNAANYCNITNYGKIAGKYYAVEMEITPSNNNFGIKTKSNHPMYLLTNNTVNNVSMFTNGNVSISTSTDLGASLGVKGAGSTSATSSFKVENSSNSDIFTVRDDRAVIIEDGGPNYVKFTDGYMVMAPNSTSNTIGPYSNQSMYIGSAITAAGNSGSIIKSLVVGTTINVGLSSNLNESLVIGKSITLEGGNTSIVMGRNHSVKTVTNSFIGGVSFTTNSTSSLLNSFIFARSTSKIDDATTGTILMGSSSYGFKGDNNVGIGGDFYSTDATLNKWYGLGDRLRGIESKQVLIGLGATGTYLQTDSGAPEGVYLGIASKRPSFGLIRANGVNIETSSAETNGLVFMGTNLPSLLDVAGTGKNVFWIEDVETAPTVAVANASAIYGESDAVVFSKNIRVDGQAHAPYSTLVKGANSIFTPDFDESNNIVTTLDSTSTFANPSNLKDGASYTIIVKQDATGGRTITSFGTAYKWAGGTAPTLSTGANAVDILTFISDGTNLYGSFVGDFQ